MKAGAVRKAYYGTLFPSELTYSFRVQAVPQDKPHELQQTLSHAKPRSFRPGLPVHEGTKMGTVIQSLLSGYINFFSNSLV